MTPSKATHQQTKQRNRDLVLKMIFEHDAISRAEVARVTKLTRATVSDMVTNLIEEGLVEEVGYGESIGGKAPILLSLVADSGYLIGLTRRRINLSVRWSIYGGRSKKQLNSLSIIVMESKLCN